MTSEWIRGHLYLVTTLWGLLTVTLCWLLAGPQRWMILAAGAACVPFFPLAGTYNNGSFWTATHLEVPPLLPMIVFGGPVGIEDVLCLFIAGARAWFFATVPARRAWVRTAAPGPFSRRAATISAVVLAAGIALRLIGLDYIAISYLLPLALGVFMLMLRRGYWPLATAGAVGSVLMSGLELRVYFMLWPEWSSAWTPGAFTSADVLGVKLGDLLWWTIVGAVHPLVMAYCAGTVRAASSSRTKPR